MPVRFGFTLPMNIAPGVLRVRCVTCEKFFRLPMKDVARARHYRIHLEEEAARRRQEAARQLREARRLKALSLRENSKAYGE